MMSADNRTKVDLLRALMAARRYADLYELVVGISKYNIASVSSRRMTSEEERAWQMTMHHLDFLSKYGDSASFIEINRRKWFAYPEEFGKWLELGAPGITIAELHAYLEAVPLGRSDS